MCGIVGILGTDAVAGALVDALRRLEYRGYDSAGVATVENGRLDRRRAEGKLKNLELRLSNHPLQGRTGLGHTRWATHGKPIERNAHPHMNDRVAVVHNGIIENFQELREELTARGHAFQTETDTETVLHLITDGLDQGLVPAAAAKAALRRLKGAFALAIIFAGEDNLMIGARQGPPLAVGHGQGEMYLGSDAIALAPFTDTITYLEDGDCAVLTRETAQIFASDDRKVERQAIKSVATSLLVDKGNFRHFMAKEIHEQPEVISHTLGSFVDFAAAQVHLPDLGIDPAQISKVSISACGTAYFAGMVGKYWLERYARIPVEIDVASEFRYREPPLEQGGLALFITQSGETADTLATLRHCKEKGQRIASIVNVRTSTIARESHVVLPTLAGPEIGVASTKAFTCQLSALACLAIALGRARGTISAAEERELTRALAEVPRHVTMLLHNEAQYERLAHELSKARDVLYLGRGINFPLALEGALKLKEISYVPTDAYAAGEMKHGPIALLDHDTPVVAVATEQSVLPKLISNLEEVRARGARVVAVASEGFEQIAGHAEHVFYVPRADPLIQVVPAIVPLQLFAYYLARERGLNVDQPRNLAKTVTVE